MQDQNPTPADEKKILRTVLIVLLVLLIGGVSLLGATKPELFRAVMQLNGDGELLDLPGHLRNGDGGEYYIDLEPAEGEGEGGYDGGYCGDWNVDYDETCDDGNTTREYCDYGQNTRGGSTNVCDSTCHYSPCRWLGECGDGSRQTGHEACDDGAANGNTSCPYGTPSCTICNSSCSQNISRTGPYCGDGTHQSAHEVCDDGNTTTETACPYGTQTCTKCRDDCQEVLNLIGPYCGDNITNGSEICDDGNTTDQGTCNADCSAATTCGDGVVQSPNGVGFSEQCDDSGESASCNADCTNHSCGDGILNVTAGEECDDENNDNDDGCNSNCVTEFCGDGILQAGLGEECDDGGTANGDGCSSSCAMETGWVCGMQPSICEEVDCQISNCNGLVSYWKFNMNQEISTSEDIGNGLAGLWHFNEASGTLDDSTANNNDGTQSGGVTYNVSSILGTALDFDGTDGNVSVPTNGMSNLEGAIAMWVKPEGWDGGDSSYQGAYQTRAPGTWGNSPDQLIVLPQWNNNYFYFRIVPDSGQGCCVNDVTFDTTGVFVDDQWTHIAATWSATDDRILVYIDGQVKNSRTGWTKPTLPLEATGYIGIGHDKYWNGLIDEPAVWNRALGQTEILELYQRGAPGDLRGVNNGTIFGDVTTVASGELNNALSFDGTDDYIALPISYGADSISATTVCAWVKSSSTDNQIVASFDRSEVWRLALEDDAGTQKAGWDTTDSTNLIHDLGTPANYTDGNWHHICGWFDKASSPDKRIYVDGQSVADSGGQAHSGNNLGAGEERAATYGFIGVGSEAGTFNGTIGPAHYFNGTIDEVMIWDRALSSTEVLVLYSAQITTFEITYEIPDLFEVVRIIVGTSATTNEAYYDANNDGIVNLSDIFEMVRLMRSYTP